MKSPIFLQDFNHSKLGLGQLYEQKKIKSPIVKDYQKNVDISTLKQFDRNRYLPVNHEYQKESFNNINITVRSPKYNDGINKNLEINQKFVNSSKYMFEQLTTNKKNQIINYQNGCRQAFKYQNNQCYSSKSTPQSKEINGIYEKDGLRYEKIIEKINKKDHLINQLREISEIKIPKQQKHRLQWLQNRKKNKELNTDRPKATKYNLSNPQSLLKDNIKQDSKSYGASRSAKNGSFHIFNDKNSSKYLIQYNIQSIRKNKQSHDLINSNKNLLYIPDKKSKSHSGYEEGKSNLKYEYCHQKFDDQINRIKDISYNEKDNLMNLLSKPRSAVSSLRTTQSSSNQIITLKDIKYYAKIKQTMSNKKLSISNFIIQKTLGQGKFGIVYQAIHKESNFVVALKKINKLSIKNNHMIDQFLLEIKIQSLCKHQNILKLYGCFDDQDYIYLILQYMQQGTLFKKLKQKKTLSQDQAAEKLKDVSSAIKYLHELGIAHRDIKPQNIVISHGVSKLCDFGWAALCNQRRKTYCGTFDYAAPEILQGVQYDMSVDLWCLGVLAYQLLVGKAPFYHISRKETIRRILSVQSASIDFPSHISKNAKSFIESLIRKSPEERMSSNSILQHPFFEKIPRQI